MKRGVFWLIDDQLYAYPFDGGYPEGIAKSGNTYNHKKLWEAARPAGKTAPFWWYPRGRVEITNQNEPVIYLSPHFGAEWLGQIMLAFGITTNPVVRYDYSAHYHCFLDKEN